MIDRKHVGQNDRSDGSNRLDAPLSSGPWCCMCRGNGLCPATQEAAANLVGDLLPSGPPEKMRKLKATMLKELESIPVEKVSYFMSQVKFLSAACDAVDKYVRGRLTEEPGSIPGWAMVEKPGNRSFESVTKAYEAVQDYLSQTEFLKHCAVKVGSLEKAIAEEVSPENKAEGRRFFGTLVKDIVIRQTKNHLEETDDA